MTKSDSKSGHQPLSWAARTQIALDAAMGIEYIHDHTKARYVHRDIKTSNILLDEGLRAKVHIYHYQSDHVIIFPSKFNHADNIYMLTFNIFMYMFLLIISYRYKYKNIVSPCTDKLNTKYQANLTSILHFYR